MLLELYISFFKIGLWGFGGGYAMLALIQNEVVTKHQWLTTQEFTDIVAISQITPGPISVNCATYVGYTVSGSWLGSAIATLGVVSPALIMMTFVSIFFIRMRDNIYLKSIIRAIRPVTIGLILAAALLLGNKTFVDPWSVLFAAGALAASFKRVNPIFIFAVVAICGILIYYI